MALTRSQALESFSIVVVFHISCNHAKTTELISDSESRRFYYAGQTSFYVDILTKPQLFWLSERTIQKVRFQFRQKIVRPRYLKKTNLSEVWLLALRRKHLIQTRCERDFRIIWVKERQWFT